MVLIKWMLYSSLVCLLARGYRLHGILSNDMLVTDETYRQPNDTFYSEVLCHIAISGLWRYVIFITDFRSSFKDDVITCISTFVDTITDFTCDTDLDIVHLYLDQDENPNGYFNIVSLCASAVTEQIIKALHRSRRVSYNWFIGYGSESLVTSSARYLKEGDNVIMISLRSKQNESDGCVKTECLSATIDWCYLSCEENDSLRNIATINDITSLPDVDWNFLPEKFHQFYGKELRIAYEIYPPFVNEKHEDGRVQLFGIEIRVIENLAQMFNFTYKFVRSVDGEWGNLVNGVWTGMVGMVHRGEADMAISGISIMESRDEVVDFLTPHYIDSSVVVFKPTRVKWRYFIKPFSPTVWLTIIVLPNFVTALLLLMLVFRRRSLPGRSSSHFDPSTPDQYGRLVVDYLTKTYGCLFGRGCRFYDDSDSTRLTVACFWLTIIMLTAVYTGNLTATLAVADIKEPFKTLEELADNDDYKLTVLSGTVQMDIFKHAKSGVFKRLWTKIKSHPGSIVYNEKAAFDRVSQSKQITYTGDKLAFLNYMATNPDSGLTVMKEEFNPGGMAIVVRENMPYREELDKAIEQMLDTGLMDHYKSLYLRRWDKRTSCVGRHKDGEPVTLSDLYLVLLCVFAGGLCFASAVLVLENALNSYSQLRP